MGGQAGKTERGRERSVLAKSLHRSKSAAQPLSTLDPNPSVSLSLSLSLFLTSSSRTSLLSSLSLRPSNIALLLLQAFKASIDDFVHRYSGANLDAVVGFEARGFIFGPTVALALGCAFVPLRKRGKLPGAVVSQEYSLEYGTDVIEVHADALQRGARVLLIDDLVATGGTLAAGVSLMETLGALVHECACVIELPELKGREKLGGIPLYVQVEKEEHTEEEKKEHANGNGTTA